MGPMGHLGQQVGSIRPFARKERARRRGGLTIHYGDTGRPRAHRALSSPPAVESTDALISLRARRR